MAERVIRIDEAPGSKPGFSIFLPHSSFIFVFLHVPPPRTARHSHSAGARGGAHRVRAAARQAMPRTRRACDVLRALEAASPGVAARAARAAAAASAAPHGGAAREPMLRVLAGGVCREGGGVGGTHRGDELAASAGLPPGCVVACAPIIARAAGSARAELLATTHADATRARGARCPPRAEA